MRVVAVSDLHLDETCAVALLRQAESADLVIVAGDLAQRREGLGAYAAQFDALADRLVLVAGNNETDAELRAATAGTVLHGDSIRRDGLTVAGIGGAIPPIHPPGWSSYNLEEAEAEAMLDRIDQADILISHSPPKGVADVFGDMGSIGSTAVRAAVDRLQPRLCLCGHVHHCWGAREMLGETLVANLGPVPVTFEL